jgi:hypothetical protein
MENRTERLVIETDRHRIVGDITLPREGFRSRVSDFLNRGEIVFIPLINVTITPHDGGPAVDRDFVAVGRPHIQVAYPADDE